MKRLWKKIKQAISEWIARNIVADDPYDATQGGATDPATDSGATKTDNSDAVPFSSLDWRWGGFNGSNAREDNRCRISSLKVSSSGCSLKWESSIPSDWTREKGLVVCALFCRIGGKWLGGKFDWIDESRKTRDFKNISGGYNGWDKDAIAKADAFAFVIVSKDGKRRTNTIKKESKA